MLDLKPANTLYDVKKKKGILIDLGGVVITKDRQNIENYYIKKDE